MSYTVNWLTKVITIPVGDLTLVSGTRYSLDMSDFMIECRRLESSFTDGLWASQILLHDNTKVDFAGADYAPFDDIINGYEVQFGAGPTRVDLLGSNNNLVDVLIPTGVAVVPSNSAGLQRVTISSGSGLSTVEHDALIEVLKLTGNKVTAAGEVITIYEDDGNTVWKSFNLTGGGRVEV